MKALFLLTPFLAGCTPITGAPLARGSTRPSICAHASLPGAETLWSSRKTRWIVVGELHGTAETPAAFGELVCLAAVARPKRRIIVAIEHPQSDQAEYDRYLNSAGAPTDRSALLQTSAWRSEFKDGRTSEAFLALIDTLRLLRQARLIDGVVLFQPSGKALTGPEEREVAMARNLEAASLDSKTLTLVLVGNVHAMRSRFVRPTFSYLPAAGHLPAEATITLDVRSNGGAAWNCIPECGPHERGPARLQAKRGVLLDPAMKPRFDGLLDLGLQTTASPPAQ